jgi:hypothetical protein
LREPLQHFSELLFGGQLLQLLPLFIGQFALLEGSQLIEIYSPSAAETTLRKDLGFDGALNPFIDQRQPRRPIARGGKLLFALRRKFCDERLHFGIGDRRTLGGQRRPPDIVSLHNRRPRSASRLVRFAPLIVPFCGKLV